MNESTQEPLHIQYGLAAATANRRLGDLTRAMAKHDYHSAERALYELQHMIELGLRYVQAHTEIEDASAEVQALTEAGPWNPHDSVRVLSLPETRANGEFYRVIGSYRQFATGDKLVAWNGRYYRIAG